MSIYADGWTVDADDHTDTCARWIKCDCHDPFAHASFRTTGPVSGNQHWRYSPKLPCTCNTGPLIYQRSHVLPEDTDPRGGSFDLAEIPGHITRDGRSRDGCPDEDDERPWPWLRVTMRAHDAADCQDVVLDRGQVASLREYLGDWLNRTEGKP